MTFTFQTPVVVKNTPRGSGLESRWAENGFPVPGTESTYALCIFQKSMPAPPLTNHLLSHQVKQRISQTKILCRTWTNYAFMVPYIFSKFKEEMGEMILKIPFLSLPPCSHPQIRLHQLSKRQKRKLQVFFHYEDKEISRSNCQHLLDHQKSERVTKKHLLPFY